MTKRKISKQQQSRISKLQQKKVQQVQHPTTKEQEGLVVAHYGTYVDIEDHAGNIYRCNIRQNLGTVVPGDKVVWHSVTENTGVLSAVLPRKTVLSRPGHRGHIKPIAANVDQVIIVIAPEPKPAASLIDSYLVAIQVLGLSAMLLCNKADLIDNQTDQTLLEQISLYQNIGYPLLLVSAHEGKGLIELMEGLRGQTSIFVGQSGVGKSSLIAALLPMTTRMEPNIAGSHGTHTTTTARLYHLSSGGDLIDSPGIRDFMLWDMPPQEIARGFIEFTPYLGQCKYRNCRHLDEPQCAILQAVRDKIISEARFASYQRIIGNL